MAGFVLSRQAPVGTWGAATFALQKTSMAERDRGHRGHVVEVLLPNAPYAKRAPGANGLGETPARAPMAPMPPMPSHHVPQSVYDDD